YVKTGNNKAAEELDKECQILAKPVQNSASFLDQYGLKPEAVPFYDKALADYPNDIAIREKFCSLLVILAKDELKENHDEQAITMLLKAKSMLVKGMSEKSIRNVISELHKTYSYGQRYREADSLWSSVEDFLPKTKETEWKNTPEQNLTTLVEASKQTHPSLWTKPEAEKIEIEKIKQAYDQYVQAIRQCGTAYKVKEEYNWATVFVIRSKQYAAKGMEHPLARMHALRRALVALADESAVISVEAGLPMKAPGE
ncbi:MAG: hypothetical protein K2X81_20820, partial [Candidatus Obscuribacterales bacterium]|nr:hypothetical protein [Candidatus Obscuribacterales bacterium]